MANSRESRLIAANISARLEELGISRRRFAKHLHRSPAWATMVLNGEREISVRYFDDIAALLKWPIERLIQGPHSMGQVAVGGGGPPPGKRRPARSKRA